MSIYLSIITHKHGKPGEYNILPEVFFSVPEQLSIRVFNQLEAKSHSKYNICEKTLSKVKRSKKDELTSYRLTNRSRTGRGWQSLEAFQSLSFQLIGRVAENILLDAKQEILWRAVYLKPLK